jgi:hypothetical protein
VHNRICERFEDRTASSPPTITSSRPFDAAGPPPLTGASMTETSWAPAFFASSRQVLGWTVLCTAITLPGCRPASTPFSPSTTSTTSASLTTQRQTRSLAAASSAGDPATFASVSENGSSASGLRAQSVVGWPASMIRRAMGPP